MNVLNNFSQESFDSKGYVRLLVHGGFGAFTLSREIYDKMIELDSASILIEEKDDEGCDNPFLQLLKWQSDIDMKRDDKTLIQAILELRRERMVDPKASVHTSDYILQIPKAMELFYEIIDDNCGESLVLFPDKYRLHHITQVNQDTTISNEIKVELTTQILALVIPRAIEVKE